MSKGRKGTYLRQVTTGQCFAWTEAMEKRADMAPWTGPLPWEKEERGAIGAGPADEPEEPKKSAADDPEERLMAIIKAVSQIPEEDYAKPPGRNPQPKVPDVSKAVGFKVSADEIAKAMEMI